ncbi:MAG TPA: SusC/RagA family TonB-linked outer membrane protein [Gemmatimonadales bacterium]|nr:SusC/RagA family TonB-linked outer membrane protein [Gemmatimonadales bacterium]
MQLAWSLAGVLLFSIPAVTQAQRTITGTVRDSVSGAPLVSARVSVQGTALLSSTNETGQFTLRDAPAGDVTVLVRAIGYRRREIPLGATVNTLSVALERDVFRMEEIVITGQATGIERRNLPNAVAVVGAEELATHPTASLEQQLQGKVAGADIQSNSGAPGGGLQVRLRGVTSVNATAEPLYVVDGVVMSDIAIASNQNAITGAAGGSSPSLNQDNQVNRIADLNPAEIESIEILKGASAAAIYGGRASNGVVIIRTKRGRLGDPRFTLSQRFGFSSLFRKYGSRRFADAAEVDAQYPDRPGIGATYCGTGACPYFDHEEELGGSNGLSFQTIGSISGGTEATRYYASGTVENTPGVIPRTGFQRQSARLNLDQRFSDKVNVSANMNVIHTLAQRGITNNDNSGVSYYYVLTGTPSFVDLRRQPDGLFPVNPFYSSNPLETNERVENRESVWRALGSARIQFDPVRTERSNLQVTVLGGLDYFVQKNNIFSPPDVQFEDDDGQPGTSLLGNSDNINANIDGNIVYGYTGESLSARTSFGVQYTRREVDINRTEARDLIAGQPNVSAGTSVRVRETRNLIRNLGFFVQEEVLLLDDRLQLTAGVRADQSSLSADASKLFYYPKAAVSYRIERTGLGWLDELKLRAAFGQTGNEPLYGQKFTPLNSTLNLGGIAGTIVGGTVGSPDLHAEREQEIEVGFDGVFFDSRLSVEASFFQKNVSDLLLTRNLAPSLGFAQEIFNAGKLRTRGVEVGATIIPVQSSTATWLFRTTFSKNDSKITELPVPPFQTGGFGVSLGVFQIEEGKSATQIVGLGGGSERVVGDANPDFRMAFTNSLTWKGWNFHALLDWQQGGSVVNLTRLLYDANGNSPDVEAAGERISTWAGGETSVYVERATFAKLREVAITYEVPTRVVQSLWGQVRTATVAVSARNLVWFATPYSGYDPEVSNFGNQPIARNIEVTPYPASRSFYFTINLGF